MRLWGYRRGRTNQMSQSPPVSLLLFHQGEHLPRKYEPTLCCCLKYSKLSWGCQFKSFDMRPKGTGKKLEPIKEHFPLQLLDNYIKGLLENYIVMSYWETSCICFKVSFVSSMWNSNNPTTFTPLFELDIRAVLCSHPFSVNHHSILIRVMGFLLPVPAVIRWEAGIHYGQVASLMRQLMFWKTPWEDTSSNVTT